MTINRYYLHFFNIIIFLIFFFMLYRQDALSQQGVIVHYGSFEDGDTLRDGDKTRNGVIVWKPGITHIVAGGYFLTGNKILQIDPGTVVKMAGFFQVDNNGTVTSWTAGGYFELRDTSAIQITGALITDIRDDGVGGDSNQDGSATVPGNPNAGSNDGWVIQYYFSTSNPSYIPGNPSFIKGSALKYLREIRNFGSLSLTNNTFQMMYRFVNFESTGEPLISHNLFEFADRTSQLVFSGLSPIINENTFRYSQFVTGAVVNAIIIGPYVSNDKNTVSPQNGTTIVSNNVFELSNVLTIGTISQRAMCQEYPDIQVSYHAKVFNNRFIGTQVGSATSGGYAIRLDIGADVSVYSNDFRNFYNPIQFMSCSNLTGSIVKVNNNRFEKISGQNVQLFGVDANLYNSGVNMNFENNYWGHPSGPNDVQPGADGITNFRGQGIYVVDNGIDYIPFLGGTVSYGSDEVHITVEKIDPLPNVPLVPEYDAEFKVSIDKLKLATAETGILVVNVKDVNGFILNTPETVYEVNASQTSLTIPNINVKIPKYNSYIYFEVKLEPRNRSVINSNIEQFKVDLPPGSLKILKVEGLPQYVIPGNNYTAKMKFKYSLSTGSPTSNGKIEIRAKEISSSGSQLVKQYPVQTLEVGPGNDKEAEKSFDVNVTVTDHLIVPMLYIEAFLFDDSGKQTGFSFYSNTAHYPGSVSISRVTIQKDNHGVPEPVGRGHYIVGDKLIFKAHYTAIVRTENITNWEAWLSEVEVMGKDFTSLGKVPINFLASRNIHTSSVSLEDSFQVITDYTIPDGAKHLVHNIRLVDPDNQKIVYTSFHIVEVVNVQQSVKKDIPAGNSTITFNPVTLSRTFSSVQSAGSATAEESPEQYQGIGNINLRSPGPKEKNEKINSFYQTNEDTYWKFISLNKYWSVYDNLPESVSGVITFTYNPASDFPPDPGFNEDSLVLAGLNPYSNELEVLPTTLDKNNHTLTAQFSKFYEIWVAASKTTIVTDVEEEGAIPTEYSLSQNYPNPFNPGTNFEFRIANFGFVKLKIYDMLGEEVAVLVNEDKSPGVYNINFNAANLASGIYFYSLTAGDYSETKKMILLK